VDFLSSSGKSITVSRAPLGYSAAVGEGTDDRVDELRGLLEAELNRRVGGLRGCWPLVVAAVGVVVGVLLLVSTC